MARIDPKQTQDIEYFSVVDRVMDVFILVCCCQYSLSSPLEYYRVCVFQMRSPRHSDHFVLFKSWLSRREPGKSHGINNLLRSCAVEFARYETLPEKQRKATQSKKAREALLKDIYRFEFFSQVYSVFPDYYHNPYILASLTSFT